MKILIGRSDFGTVWISGETKKHMCFSTEHLKIWQAGDNIRLPVGNETVGFITRKTK